MNENSLDILLRAIIQRPSASDLKSLKEQLKAQLGDVEVKIKTNTKPTDEVLQMQKQLGQTELNRIKRTEEAERKQALAQNKALEDNYTKQVKNQETIKKFNNEILSQIDKLKAKYDMGNMTDVNKFADQMKNGISSITQMNNAQSKLNQLTGQLKTSHQANTDELNKEIQLERQLERAREETLKINRTIQQQREKETQQQSIQNEKALQYEQRIRQTLQQMQQRESDQAKSKAEKEQKATQEAEKQLAIYRQMASIKLQNLQTKYGNLSNNTEFQNVQSSINGLTTSDVQTGNLSQVNTNIRQLEANLRQTNSANRTFIGSMGEAISKFALWGGSITIVMQTLNKFREGIEFIKEMNAAFTTLQMEMTNTKLDFKEVTNQTNELATSFGSTTKQVTEAIGIFSNYNTTMDEVIERSKAAVILSNISGQSVKDASNNLQGIMAQFKMSSDQSISVVDQIAGTARVLKVDYADAIKEVANGMNTVGSVADLAGVKTTELSGLVGTLVEKTKKSGNEVANSIKTIFSRIRNVGEESDPEAFKGIEKQMYALGFQIKDMTDGSMKPMMTMLDEMALKWKTMDDVSKAALTKAAANVYRSNIFTAMMENWDTVKKNVESATDSQGVAAQKQEIYNKSLQASINRLQDAWDALFISMSNNSSWKGFLNGITQMVNGLTSLSGKFGAIPTILALATTAAVLFKKELSMLAITMSSTGKINFVGAIPTMLKSASGALRNFTTEMRVFNATQREGNANISIFRMGLNSLRNTTIAQTVATGALTVASIALNAALTMGIGLLIGAGITAVMEWANSWGKAEEKQQEYIKTTQENISSLKNQKQGLSELSKEYEVLKQKEENLTITTDEKARLLEIQKELVKTYGVSATGIDNEGNAISNSTELIKERNEELQRQIDLEKQNLEIATRKSEKSDLGKITNTQTLINEAKSKLVELRDYKSKLEQELSNPSQSTYIKKLMSESFMGFDEAVDRLKTDLNATKFEIDNYTTVLADGSNELKPIFEKRKQVIDGYYKDAIKNTELNGGKLSDAAKQTMMQFSDAFSKTSIPLDEVNNTISDFANSLQSSGFSKLQSTFEDLKKQYQNAFKLDDENGMKIASESIKNIITNMKGVLYNSVKDLSLPKEVYDKMFANFDKQYNFDNLINGLQKVSKAREQAFDFEKAEKELKGYADQLEGLRKIITETSQEDLKMSEQSFDFLAKNYPELIGYMNNIPLLQQKINEKIEEQKAIAQDTYTNMMLNSKEFTDYAKQAHADLINELARQYGVDQNNYKTLAEFKYATESKLISAIAADWAEFYDTQGNLMTQHFEAAFEEGGKFQQELSNAISEIAGTSPGLEAAERGQAAMSVQKEAMDKAQKISADIKSKLSGLSDKFKSMTGDFGKAFSSSTTPSGSKDSASKGSTSSSEEANEKALERDRYLELNQALAQTNILLERNEALQQNASTKERIALLDEETKLLKEKQINLHNIAEEQRNELSEKQSELSAYGITFNENGNISNLQDVSNAVTSSVNAHRTDKDKTQYKELKEYKQDFDALVKRYQELQEIIPKQSNEWLKLQKQINDISLDKLKAEFDDFDKSLKPNEDKLAELNYQIDMLDERDPNKLSKTMSILKQETTETKKEAESLNKEIDILNQKLANGNLSSGEVEVLKEQISKLQKDIQDKEKQIKDLQDSQRETKTSMITKDIEKFEKNTGELYENNISDIDYKLSMLSDSDYAEKIKLNAERQAYLNKEIQVYSDKLSDITAMIPHNADDAEYLSEQADKFKKKIQDLNKELKTTGKTSKETADTLVETFQKKLLDSIDDEIKSIEKSTNTAKDASETKIQAIQNQIDLLEKENDEYKEQEERLKKIKDLETQRETVSNLQKEKTVQLYVKGQGFVWSVDSKKLKEETSKLQDMETDYADWEKDIVLKKQINTLKAQQEQYKKEQDALEKSNNEKIQKLKDFQEKYNNKVSEDKDIKTTTLQDVMDALKGVEDGSYSTRISSLQSFINQYNALMSTQTSTSNSSSGGSWNQTVSSGESTQDYTGIDINGAPASITGGEDFGTPVDIGLWSSVGSYDVGGKVPKTGLKLIHEGEQVLTNQQTTLFERMINWLPTLNNIKLPTLNTSNNSTTNSESFAINGNITVQTNDATGFLNQLKRLARSK